MAIAEAFETVRLTVRRQQSEGGILHLGQKRTKDAFVESDELRAEVERLSSMSVTSVAVEVMAKAFTGEAGADETEPSWVDPFGRGPSLYEVANWLFVPRSE